MLETAAPSLLVVEQDSSRRSQWSALADRLGASVHAVGSLPAALGAVRVWKPQIVVAGSLAGGAAAMHELLEATPRSVVVRAARDGAEARQLEAHLSEAIAAVVRELPVPKHVTRELEVPPDRIIGAHPSIGALMRRVELAAQSQATVLILGETGSGKEEVAAALHARSRRSTGPYVRLNCAALAPSVIESELFG